MRVRLYFEGHRTVAGVPELLQALPTTTHMNQPDINFFAGDPEAVVEPWQPQVGDRVRVRLSGECQAKLQCFDDRTNDRLDIVTGHFEAEDGKIGTVVSSNPTIPMLTSPDHSFVVLFDKKVYLLGRYYCSQSAFAACELEPL